MSDDLKEALALLRRKRAAAQAMVDKYDRAVEALLAIEDDESPRHEAPTQPEPGSALVVPPEPRPSVLTMAKSLLDEGDRLWTVGAIIQEYENRGAPINSTDPPSALRTALSTLVKRHEVVRESPGYFRSARFASVTVSPSDSWQLDDSDAVEDGGGLRLTGS